MDEMGSQRRRRYCPHCGKEIPRLPVKPRDLGLLLNVLLYRVPVEKEISEGWIEVARKHCRMKPERLAEVRAGLHARHWPRMIERRAARLAYFKEHGKLPPRWKGLLPGEGDHVGAMSGFRRYRKCGLAKMKARLRKHPETEWGKLTNRYISSHRIKSKPRKSAALDDLLCQTVAMVGAKAGKLKLQDFELLKEFMPQRPSVSRGKRRHDRSAAKGATPSQATVSPPASAPDSVARNAPA